MQSYVIWTTAGRRFFVNCTFSHEAEPIIRPHLNAGETIAAWDMLTGRDINNYPYIDLRKPRPEPVVA